MLNLETQPNKLTGGFQKNLFAEKANEERIENSILIFCREWQNFLKLKSLPKRTISFTLEYGSKKIILDLIPSKASVSATTYIEKQDNGKSHKINETTLLYSTALKIMREAADKFSLPIIYTLSTQSNQITSWASSEKGNSLFHWDQISTDKDSHLNQFEKIIYPCSSIQH